MACNRLLKSCATPPASSPTASIFCAWRNCSFKRLVSVTSRISARFAGWRSHAHSTTRISAFRASPSRQTSISPLSRSTEKEIRSPSSSCSRLPNSSHPAPLMNLMTPPKSVTTTASGMAATRSVNCRRKDACPTLRRNAANPRATHGVLSSLFSSMKVAPCSSSRARIFGSPIRRRCGGRRTADRATRCRVHGGGPRSRVARPARAHRPRARRRPRERGCVHRDQGRVRSGRRDRPRGALAAPGRAVRGRPRRPRSDRRLARHDAAVAGQASTRSIRTVKSVWYDHRSCSPSRHRRTSTPGKSRGRRTSVASS